MIARHKMLFRYWGLEDQYQTKEKICNDFNQLVDENGFSLTKNFNNVIKLQ